MKNEINLLIATDGAELELNQIFKLKRVLHKNPMNQNLDKIVLFCELPGFPVLTKNIVARNYTELMAEVETAMAELMNEATAQLTKCFKNGKL